VVIFAKILSGYILQYCDEPHCLCGSRAYCLIF